MKPVKVYRREMFELVYENGKTLTLIAKHPESQYSGCSEFSVRGTILVMEQTPDGHVVERPTGIEVKIEAASVTEAADRAQLEFEAAVNRGRIMLPAGQIPPDLNLRNGG